MSEKTTALWLEVYSTCDDPNPLLLRRKVTIAPVLHEANVWLESPTDDLGKPGESIFLDAGIRIVVRRWLPDSEGQG